VGVYGVVELDFGEVDEAEEVDELDVNQFVFEEVEVRTTCALAIGPTCLAFRTSSFHVRHDDDVDVVSVWQWMLSRYRLSRMVVIW
jgi:hypothetical protein